MGGLPAGERAAEHFAQRRQGIAFVLGEGEQGAQRRGLHHRRVGSGSTLGVNQAAGGHGFAFMPGDAGFTKGDGAGGVVQQQRRMARAGKHHAQRVGAEAAVLPAERGDHRVADDADEVNGDQPGGGALFGPVADASDVMRIAQGDSRHTMLLRLFNA